MATFVALKQNLVQGVAIVQWSREWMSRSIKYNTRRKINKNWPVAKSEMPSCQLHRVIRAIHVVRIPYVLAESAEWHISPKKIFNLLQNIARLEFPSSVITCHVLPFSKTNTNLNQLIWKIVKEKRTFSDTKILRTTFLGSFPKLDYPPVVDSGNRQRQSSTWTLSPWRAGHPNGR